MSTYSGEDHTRALQSVAAPLHLDPQGASTHDGRDRIATRSHAQRAVLRMTLNLSRRSTPTFRPRFGGLGSCG